MLQKITELWPDLLAGNQEGISGSEDAVSEVPGPLIENEEPIEEIFKGLKWTRVIDLRDYQEASINTFKMVDDIKECLDQMHAVKMEGLPQLVTYFDPIHWQATNPQHHLCIYKLNQEQLKDWGEIATEVRKKIMKKAQNHQEYSEPKPIIKDHVENRRSMPHSTRSSNLEGLLESQLKARQQAQAGISRKCKKRHLKDLPLETREAICKMYLEDGIFQCDVAKFFKVSPMLVSKLVKEAQQDPNKAA